MTSTKQSGADLLEQTKRFVIRHFQELVNNKDLDAIDARFSSPYFFDEAPPGSRCGGECGPHHPGK
jgi:hypothetical protein